MDLEHRRRNHWEFQLSQPAHEPPSPRDTEEDYNFVHFLTLRLMSLAIMVISRNLFSIMDHMHVHKYLRHRRKWFCYGESLVQFFFWWRGKKGERCVLWTSSSPFRPWVAFSGEILGRVEHSTGTFYTPHPSKASPVRIFSPTTLSSTSGHKYPELFPPLQNSKAPNIPYGMSPHVLHCATTTAP